MKKIKRKTKPASRKRPSFVVGFSNEDPPPPGFLVAWYNQFYGGPLMIRFPEQSSNTTYEACHVDWQAFVSQVDSTQESLKWIDQLAWDHSQALQIVSTSPVGCSKMDVVLFLARLARGLTILTEGTAYDVVTGHYFNPSDWSERLLNSFNVENHVQVSEEEHLIDGRQWLYTRGLTKFGLEEIETFQARGLPSNTSIDRLLAFADWCVVQGKSPKVGERVQLTSEAVEITVVNHRTHSLPDGQLNLREVQWAY